MDSICGIIVPVITPFHDDESLNEEELKNQINRQISAGVHGIFCLGTNGEFFSLTGQEKLRVIQVTVEAAGHRCPVFAGTGCTTTRETIHLSLQAKDAGADVLSIICPYFAVASQEEIYRHYAAISEAVDMPIVLYNIPARTGNSITPSTLKRLTKVANIVAVKDSSGNFDNMLQYLEVCAGTDIKVISGNDSLILWNLIAGGCGGIAGCANVLPHTLVSIYENYIAGDFEAAKRYQNCLRPLRNVFRYGNPNTVVKMAVAMMGYPVGACRSPFNQLCEEGVRELKTVLKNYADQGIR